MMTYGSCTYICSFIGFILAAYFCQIWCEIIQISIIKLVLELIDDCVFYKHKQKYQFRNKNLQFLHYET